MEGMSGNESLACVFECRVFVCANVGDQERNGGGNRMSRTFEDKPAIREQVPLTIGEYGPSGCGKTYSALRLATGIQRITGGDIYGIDTESRRMLHYADLFKFKHLEFGSPFSPLDYLAAIEHCYKKGARIIIVDSASHEHEGPGGVLEMHEQEVQRLAGGDRAKAERINMLAWAKPKAERRRLINTILQMNANFIFCFRAKEKVKLPKRGDPDRDVKQLGFMPIAGEEYLYEMTLNCLLLPNSGGVPSWHPEEMGEKAMVKLPIQFRQLFKDSRPLDEAHGEALALWAKGSSSPLTDVSKPVGAEKATPRASSESSPTGPPLRANGRDVTKLVNAFGAHGILRTQIEEKLGKKLEDA